MGHVGMYCSTVFCCLEMYVSILLILTTLIVYPEDYTTTPPPRASMVYSLKPMRHHKLEFAQQTYDLGRHNPRLQSDQYNVLDDGNV